MRTPESSVAGIGGEVASIAGAIGAGFSNGETGFSTGAEKGMAGWSEPPITIRPAEITARPRSATNKTTSDRLGARFVEIRIIFIVLTQRRPQQICQLAEISPRARRRPPYR